MIQVITRSIETMQSQISFDTASAATILIEPSFPEANTGWKLRRFHEGRRYAPAGVAAAESALPRIASALPWVQGSTASA